MVKKKKKRANPKLATAKKIRPAKKKGMADRMAAEKPATKKRPKADRQKMIKGAFPEYNQEIETKVGVYLTAKEDAKSVSLKVVARYDALKEVLRAAGFTDHPYSCYDHRLRVLLNSEDPKVKIEKLKAEESTPFEG